jgi:hypothetical protein
MYMYVRSSCSVIIIALVKNSAELYLCDIIMSNTGQFKQSLYSLKAKPLRSLLVLLRWMQGELGRCVHVVIQMNVHSA